MSNGCSNRGCARGFVRDGNCDPGAVIRDRTKKDEMVKNPMDSAVFLEKSLQKNQLTELV